jgi:hypothetical protein
LPGALCKGPFADGSARQRGHIFFAFHIDKHIYIYIYIYDNITCNSR